MYYGLPPDRVTRHFLGSTKFPPNHSAQKHDYNAPEYATGPRIGPCEIAWPAVCHCLQYATRQINDEFQDQFQDFAHFATLSLDRLLSYYKSTSVFHGPLRFGSY